MPHSLIPRCQIARNSCSFLNRDYSICPAGLQLCSFGPLILTNSRRSIRSGRDLRPREELRFSQLTQIKEVHAGTINQHLKEETVYAGSPSLPATYTEVHIRLTYSLLFRSHDHIRNTGFFLCIGPVVKEHNSGLVRLTAT